MNTSEYHWTGSIEHATPLLLNKASFYNIYVDYYIGPYCLLFQLSLNNIFVNLDKIFINL